MRFDGEWLVCDDGVVRPVMRAEVLAGDNTWHAVELLVDTGADRTVFGAGILKWLNLEVVESKGYLGGVGGLADSVNVRTQVCLVRDDGEKVVFRGEYAACIHADMLDISVLGRDILNMFVVIVDRKATIVSLIGGQHRYEIRHS